MTFARVFTSVESQNLLNNVTNSLIELSSDRNALSTGGFFDNWDDSTTTDVENNSAVPFKLHYYRVRVYVNQPCVIYTSDVENLRLAKTAPGGTDTAFTQRNMANSIIKKWTLTNGAVTGATGFGGGGVWSYLAKHWTKRIKTKKGWKTVGSPAYYNDKMFKVQIKNLSPNDNTAEYRYIGEYGVEYDATSPN